MGVVLLSVAAIPRNLEDAGQTLGVTRFSRFVRINLPLMAPGFSPDGDLRPHLHITKAGLCFYFKVSTMKEHI